MAMTKEEKIQKARAALESLHEALSVEQVTSNVTGGEKTGKLASMVDNGIKYVKGTLNTISTFFRTEDNKGSASFPSLATAPNNFKYIEMTHHKVQIPEGFTGKLTDYISDLTKANQMVNQAIVMDLILPFDVYIAKIINQPTLLASFSHTHKVKEKDVTKVTKGLAKYFTGRKETLVPFQKCFGNMNEVLALRNEAIALQKELDNVDIAKVKEAEASLSSNLAKLIAILKDNSNVINVSSKTLDNISDLTLELAKQVEAFAVINSMSITAMQCVQVLESSLKR
nr:MAG TPA: hypothetical protein [Caudoviricetes sp.]